MAEQLKYVYTEDYIKNLGNKIKENYKDFDEKAFLLSIFDTSWDDLELKQRMRHIAKKLNKELPFSYEKQLSILKLV
jgi:3-methyladenine DNA glycosylase AlkC